MSKRSILRAIVSVVIVARSVTFAQNALPFGSAGVPVLVELFTSEGCSSCPPADRFLQALDGQPLAGAQFVILSEHVDYWDHEGWKDPYSSHGLTERQIAYGKQFHLKDVYTPEIVVDGTRQFSGNDAKNGKEVFEQSLAQPKTAIRISNLAVDGTRLRAFVETDPINSSSGVRSAEVYVVLALNHVESQVAAGENAKRVLTHSAVVKKLSRIGKVKVGESFSHNLDLKADSASDARNLRVIAFLQDPDSGKVIGSAMKIVDSSSANGGPPK